MRTKGLIAIQVEVYMLHIKKWFHKEKVQSGVSQLGILAGPTTIITLFCEVLHVPTATNAAISIGTILIISLCLYRDWINSRVPASLVLALLLGLAFVFFINYQNILLKDTGLVRYYKKSADYQAEVGRDIKQAAHEIWFFGTNFHISTVDRSDAILDALKRGVRVRYLVYNPFSERLPALAHDFDQTPAELSSECRNALQSLLGLRKRWQQARTTTATPGELEIRVFEATPRARLYVFDPDEKSGFTLLVPYINSVNSPQLPGFLLQNLESGVYADYFAGLRKTWGEADRLDDLERSHPEYLKSL